MPSGRSTFHDPLFTIHYPLLDITMADSSMFDAIARQGRLVRKELLEILRDRRTIVTLVLMPLLIYPLLGVGFMQFARALAPQKDPVFYVAAEDPEALDRFARLEA